jgi:hypothetical protein
VRHLRGGGCQSATRRSTWHGFPPRHRRDRLLQESPAHFPRPRLKNLHKPVCLWASRLIRPSFCRETHVFEFQRTGAAFGAVVGTAFSFSKSASER